MWWTLQVGQDRRRVAEALDVLDVGGVLEPEDLVLLLAEAAARSLSSRDVIAQPPPAGPRSRRTPLLLDERVLVRAHLVAEPRRLVVRVVLEIGGQEADLGQLHEGVAQHRVPALRGASTTSSSSSIMYGDVVSRKARA